MIKFKVAFRVVADKHSLAAAVNLLGVSLGYFYARSRRSHKGRLEEWSETMMKNHELEHLHPMKYGRIADRELLEVKVRLGRHIPVIKLAFSEAPLLHVASR